MKQKANKNSKNINKNKKGSEDNKVKKINKFKEKLFRLLYKKCRNLTAIVNLYVSLIIIGIVKNFIMYLDY